MNNPLRLLGFKIRRAFWQRRAIYLFEKASRHFPYVPSESWRADRDYAEINAERLSRLMVSPFFSGDFVQAKYLRQEGEFARARYQQAMFDEYKYKTRKVIYVRWKVL